MPDAPAGLGATLNGVFFTIWISSTSVHYTTSYARRTLDHGVWKLVLAHLYFLAKLATLFGGRLRSVLVASSLLLSCTSFGFGIVAIYSSKHFDVPLFAFQMHATFVWQTLAANLSAILTDTVISGAMLVHMRSAQYAARDESVLAVLSRYFLETNLLVTIVWILSLAFLLAWNAEGRQSEVSLALSFVLPGLYLLSMLASLDAVGDTVQGGLSRTMKHASSLSDMFKGVPLNRMDSPAIRERLFRSEDLAETSAP
ncbi:hypothetical protein Rt10032_c14g5360 [Rhodotorula toruloides]|uniref:DUF6534 domain-containing protein n=1 Tax=Rhodotorula toruloides TaxID=5286 RepID=A0A511KLT3_RHOTO|nr:hypothetical protein Rt10032_c14g5360 [Rhodotorula toruloides]